MLTTRLALALVLLPTLAFAAGCDKDPADPEDGKDPIADSEGEAETDGDGMTGANESEGESEGESESEPDLARVAHPERSGADASPAVRVRRDVEG